MKTSVARTAVRQAMLRLLPSRLPIFLFAAFAAITTMAVFVPLSPTMPTYGLDPSWKYAMNEAVARHLRIGTDLLFTLGPYASVYSRVYHPATDHLMLFGSLVLGASYLIPLLHLGLRKPWVLCLLMLFLSSFVSTAYFTRDALLLSLPLLLVAYVSRPVRVAPRDEGSALSAWQGLQLIVAFASLGLLPLVKGSFLLPSGAAALISFALLWRRFHSKLALIPLLVPIPAAAAFWSLSGQLLVDLPAFLARTLSLTSGYTEAMSYPGSWPTAFDYGLAAAYVLVVALLFHSLVRSPEVDGTSKWLLGPFLAVFVLVAFKAGFVRYDLWHVVTSIVGIAVGALIMSFLYVDRALVAAVVVASVAVAAVSVRYDPILSEQVARRFGSSPRRSQVNAFVAARAIGTFSRSALANTRDTYVEAWRGLRSRVTEGSALPRRFAAALADLRTRYAVPALAGTSDVYSWDQAALLASGNVWNPRPVFQSYAAYSRSLARLNEQHLRGSSAPDNVLFNVQTIDERLPSLDDGPSWLALLDDYTVVSQDDRLAYMRRKPIVRGSSGLETIHEGVHATGTAVALPELDGPMYAVVDLEPTLLGKLATALFKPPQLRLTLKLRDGTVGSYRMIAGMASAGFILSPLIRSTQDFVRLAAGDLGFQRSAKVDSISIAPSFGGSLLWSGTYTLKLSSYRRAASSAVPEPGIGERESRSLPDGHGSSGN